MKSNHFLRRMATSGSAIPFVVISLTLLGIGSALPRNGAPAVNGTEDVLILYINETAPIARERENYKRVIDWLETSGRKDAVEMAGGLSRDLTAFREAVDREIDTIRKCLIRCDPSMHVVVFTNRSVRDGEFWIGAGGTDHWQRASIEPLRSDDFILQSNPLASAAMFRRALNEVTRHFDPHVHHFVLVTKSHGNEEMALMTRLRVHAEDTNQLEVLRLVGKGFGKKKLDLNLPIAFRREIGITKEEYFAAIEELGAMYGMKFGLVLMESCHGGMNGSPADWKLPRNVDQVFGAVTDSIGYSNVDYDVLFQNEGAERSLSNAFAPLLAKKFVRVAAAPFRYQLLLYYIPLLIVIGYVCERHRSVAKRQPS